MIEEVYTKLKESGFEARQAGWSVALFWGCEVINEYERKKVGKPRLTIIIVKDKFTHIPEYKMCQVFEELSLHLHKYTSWSTYCEVFIRKKWPPLNQQILARWLLWSSTASWNVNCGHPLTPKPLLRISSPLRCWSTRRPWLKKGIWKWGDQLLSSREMTISFYSNGTTWQLQLTILVN